MTTPSISTFVKNSFFLLKINDKVGNDINFNSLNSNKKKKSMNNGFSPPKSCSQRMC